MRTRMIRSLAFFAAVVVALLPWANDIYTLVAGPWLEALPAGSQLIATRVASPVLVPVKTALYVAVLLCAPYAAYQVWGFIAPGLYTRERTLVAPMTLASAGLFYLGAAFAFFAVFPVVFGFLNYVNPEGVVIMTDISHYLSFVLGATVAFGAAFQVPVIVIALVASGIVSADRLAHMRPYVIVGSFVAGMLLTPPDVVSQILLAVPVWLLFEAGLFVSRRLKRSARMEPASNPDASAPEPDSKK
ncbi:MAG: twin-arginine translocase subunit TatC [Gammaproteobacteria bacterium]|nr:twin-arginine translocase subunit TatC [Gammaproteobacteria bacterium]